MFWSQPKPCAKSIGCVPRPETFTWLRWRTDMGAPRIVTPPSGEPEALALDEGAEVGTPHGAVLLHFVAAPVAAAAVVVGVELALDRGGVVAVGMHRRRKREARAERLLRLGIAEGDAGDGHDPVGKREERVDFRDVVADLADRAAAEAGELGGGDEGAECERGIDGGVEESVEVLVREPGIAPGEEAAQAPAVGAEDEELGRLREPG